MEIYLAYVRDGESELFPSHLSGLVYHNYWITYVQAKNPLVLKVSQREKCLLCITAIIRKVVEMCICELVQNILENQAFNYIWAF